MPSFFEALASPSNYGLLGGAQGLLSAGGPSPQPIGIGPALGRGIGGFLGANTEAQQLMMRQALTQGQLSQYGMQNQLGQAQLDDRTSQMKQQAERQQGILQFAQQLPPEQRQAFILNPQAFLAPYSLKPGEQRMMGSTPMATGVPVPPTESPVARLMAERDALPPNDPRRSIYDNAISKATTHQPPLVQMGLGSPVPVETPQGPRLVLPPTKPGGKAEIVEIPGAGPAIPARSEEQRLKREEAEQKQAKATVDIQRKSAIVSAAVDSALQKIPQVGMFGTAIERVGLAKIPDNAAYDMNQQIDTIKANIGFKELQDMRAASPTGGALGQIAVRELEFLQAALGSLDIGQSTTQLTKNLRAVKTHFDNWKKAVEQANTGAPSMSPTTPETPVTPGWTPDKETRYQELLRKRSGAQ